VKTEEPNGIDDLLAKLGNEDCDVRARAVETLGRIGDIRALEPVLVRLEDVDWEVQAKAYEAAIAILNRNAPEPETEDLFGKSRTVPGPWNVGHQQ